MNLGDSHKIVIIFNQIEHSEEAIRKSQVLPVFIVSNEIKHCGFCLPTHISKLTCRIHLAILFSFIF